jgi:hypothetical protein
MTIPVISMIMIMIIDNYYDDDYDHEVTLALTDSNDSYHFVEEIENESAFCV